MEIEHHPITDRQSWLERRKLDLTASDLGAVLGVDSYRTALAVFSEKLGLVSVAETPLMRRGRWLEAAAHEAIVEQHPEWKVIHPRVYVRAPQIRLGCTPDRIAEAYDEDGLINLQIKTISRPTFERWQGQPPMSYTLQTACEGMLLGARTSFLSCLVISTYSAELVEFEIPRHEGAEIRIRQTAIDFWTDMAAGRLPKPDFRRDAEVVAALYHQPKPNSQLDLSGSNRIGEVLAERAKLKARVKADSEEIDALETEIKAEMGDNETASLPGWKISWKRQVRREHVVPEATFRSLRVTDEREEQEDAA